MAIKVARGQITIIDQNDAVSLQAFIGSSQPLTQVFNKDTGVYAPSWAASPFLVLTPSLFVSGKAATDQISSVGNAATLTAGVKSGSAKWYKNGSAITSGQDSCTVGAASAKYALTIKANHMTVSTPQVRYAFEAVYIDAKAVLYRNGEVLDDDGTAYTYTWKLWNSAGTSVIKTYTGKSITVSKADVTGKGVLMCEVSK